MTNIEETQTELAEDIVNELQLEGYDITLEALLDAMDECGIDFTRGTPCVEPVNLQIVKGTRKTKPIRK